jgi:protein-tyrosine-phosphatase
VRLGDRAPAAGPRVPAVLFVCHANTARSVMAQALLERMLEDRGAAGRIRVRSGGVAPYARDGMLASLDARLVLREHGVYLGEDGIVSTDLRRHRHLVGEADVILTMTSTQKTLVGAFAEARGRPIFTLREFAGESGDIEDPAAQGEAAFRACVGEIERCLGRALDRILAMDPPAHPR